MCIGAMVRGGGIDVMDAYRHDVVICGEAKQAACDDDGADYGEASRPVAAQPAGGSRLDCPPMGSQRL